MQFSYLLSALLATLAVASPIANPVPQTEVGDVEDFTDVVSRGIGEYDGFTTIVARTTTQETPAYEKAKSAHSDLKKDQYYWFELTWDLGEPADGSAETPTELQKLQAKLGFEHIALVVGQIKETETGPKKNRILKKDFIAMQYDLIKKSDGSAEHRNKNWTPAAAGKTMKWGGQTTAKKAEQKTLNNIGKILL